ncbi:MAG TPA: 3-phosphoshikimate 1-carboxyvinyltransferase [Archaeoglobus profundus]|nr:3-phosphoshikimate 1-carboxyvinyltransferase [Archaeoglobus profundus]HIP58330.1 3-phosphoshikimate 1-carboxyvinyltransferase [Archaeoglobus profundus]
MDVIIKKSEINGVAYPPSSKSYTHRAILSASLSPNATVHNPLISDDTLATLNCCIKIGASIIKIHKDFKIYGCQEIEGGKYFYAANSGTTMRLFIGILSLSKSPKYSVLDGDESLKRRPNYELVLALNKLGANIKGFSKFEPPIWIRGIVKGGEVEIEAKSSQFVSSLLFTLPLADGDSIVRISNLKSKPYVDITLHVLEESGIDVEVDNKNTFYVKGGQSYRLRSFKVPADFTSASYLIAAGILAGKVKILNMFDSKQGDKKIVEIVKEMGGKIRWDKNSGVILAEKSELEGVEVDAKDIPDLVPTISILAAVAKGKTVIYNAEHLKIKEIDRIEGIYLNLKKLGINVKKRDDGLEIVGGKIEGGLVESFGDHRMALAFSLLGLIAEKGITVRNAEVVSVSYPGYFDMLKRLGANIEFKY